MPRIIRIIPMSVAPFDFESVPFCTTHFDNARQISRRWSTGRSDTRSAFGSSETNGPSPFILEASKVQKSRHPAPVSAGLLA